jgi:hypothetical protein
MKINTHITTDRNVTITKDELLVLLRERLADSGIFIPHRADIEVSREDGQIAQLSILWTELEEVA